MSHYDLMALNFTEYMLSDVTGLEGFCQRHVLSMLDTAKFPVFCTFHLPVEVL